MTMTFRRRLLLSSWQPILLGALFVVAHSYCPSLMLPFDLLAFTFIGFQFGTIWERRKSWQREYATHLEHIARMKRLEAIVLAHMTGRGDFREFLAWLIDVDGTGEPKRDEKELN